MSIQQTVFVTGASGFVGRRVVDKLACDGYEVIAGVRKPDNSAGSASKQIVFDLAKENALLAKLTGITTVIHTAARVHIMDDSATDPLAEFRKINTQGTLNLARQAAQAGVKRFIFLSSIKVNGEGTRPDQRFTPDDDCSPDDPYGVSKYEAEKGLVALAEETGMEVVIIRPPLVYGPGVKANFATMMAWVKKGVPLPLGAVDNKRSMIALDNLVNFIILCIDHPKAANELFLIADGEDVSTTELLQKVVRAYGKKARLLPVPVSWMVFAAKLVNKEDVANRLFSSLQIDNSKAKHLLGWQAVTSMTQQLQAMVEEGE